VAVSGHSREPDVAALAAILQDRTAHIDERDDAAMYLGQSDDEAALTSSLALRVPAPPGYTLPGGASEEELNDFEARTVLPIAVQLRAWLVEVNGAMIGPGGLLGVRGPRDFLSIDNCLRMYPEWRELGWVPIASDGTGNYWVTLPGPDGSDGWVAFIDTHLDPEAINDYAASTVFRFLGFLLESELGNRGWPGNRKYVLARDPGLSSVPDSLVPWRWR
jgi:SMI1/KNR4 family protein SUKH-1